VGVPAKEVTGKDLLSKRREWRPSDPIAFAQIPARLQPIPKTLDGEMARSLFTPDLRGTDLSYLQ
jgi:hypothetical protein